MSKFIDYIVVSNINNQYYRIRVNTMPKRIGREFYYEAEVIDSSDYMFMRYAEEHKRGIMLSPEVYDMLVKSTLINMRGDGYGMISLLKRFIGVQSPDLSIAFGHFMIDFSEHKVRYIPEFSDSAKIIHCIDFELEKIVLFTPCFNSSKLIMWIVDSDYNQLKGLDGKMYPISTTPPQMCYAFRNTFNIEPYVLSIDNWQKPEYVVVFGKVVVESITEGNKYVLKFIPALSSEKVKILFKGWGIFELLGPEQGVEVLKKLGIPESIVLSAAYWRDVALHAVTMIKKIHDYAMRLGFDTVANQLEQAIKALDSLISMSEQFKISPLALFTLPEVTRRTLMKEETTS